jgi:hypothetical protein
MKKKCSCAIYPTTPDISKKYVIDLSLTSGESTIAAKTTAPPNGEKKQLRVIAEGGAAKGLTGI